MKKIMLIGTIGAGKTTLAQALKNELIEYKKTQAIEFDDYIIDTPGEYIENKVYYNALISTAVDADVIALVHDSTKEDNSFPPGFGNMFNKEVIGICTKTDLCEKEENLKRSKEYLSSAGAQNIFCISAANNIEIEELKEYLELN
ncbi:EutP/PduV family microcompartment system protein [Clostridium tetani]|uniref:Ethanolamine utilization protein EutP n=1 Tax=Clostridium tetani TaxID=1513 RepID=A0ABY0EPF2_CLOTA|nr:EutP/PduV family microcompartment system protein [Clostridium tetani]CDI50352.1 ethanolamine utilization protein eutP [Clostridium tetani 12124569]KHO36245.1 ethanolamine utilization protein EutP [Clostridium tetani]RXI39173.1 ethanolamine utilization protein EutP [Clostridium tetani]RXI55961.1 ethanolamine utilization protein EutP [Clostridium tetani]RXI66086.1 ethanolamine utilization protein EutP [Clostridium tetani]